MKPPKNWRQLEIANGRSPKGKPWEGLHGEIRTEYPTKEGYRRLARYTKLRCTYGIDHRTCLEQAYGVDDRESEALMQSWILDGLLIVG